MKRKLWLVLRTGAALGLVWLLAAVCEKLGSNRSTPAMLLLFAVLAIATLGDRVLALLTSIGASLAFSYYFVDPTGARALNVQTAITLVTMLLTGFTGTHLATRAQQRAQEAIRRREEMERLNELGKVLLVAHTVSEAAESAVRKLVDLFGLEGAVLRVEGALRDFQAGRTDGVPVAVARATVDGRADILELHGPQPSEEVRNAIASMIGLVLERARNAEERARMEAAARGEEMRSTVLNALAHNFKTPLTSIKAAASVLRSGSGLPAADEHELIVAIDEEADRLDRLIRESLDLARIEGRRANPHSEACSLAVIVDNVISKMARYLGRREFVIDLPEDLPPVMGDAFLFEQMVLQIVDNAWKYSVPGARIRVSGIASEGSVILTVHNEGSEIPENERERIFDKFYRGSKYRTRIEGTGLGLAIARNIAEAFNGKVWLEMEPGGPAFRFALPAEAGTGGPMIEKSTILLVDDEPQIRRVLRTSLTAQGANVLDVQNGEEALDLLREHTVDLILLDLNMPGMGGLEACRAIRNGWDVPIIVVSVQESDRDKVEALDAGADDFVTKPFSFDELMARIRAALRRTGFATDTTPKRISVPGLEIDFAERRVVAGGKAVRLTPTEFDILRYLISQANKPVPHRKLLQAIWGPEYGDQIEYLRVFINQLRKKIEPPGQKPTFIATEPRIGYRFVLPVEQPVA